MKRPTPNNREKVMKDGDFLVSKTDPKGVITYGNEVFIEISGYEEDELLGTPHSIIRHPDMPKAVFKLLWDRVKNKQEIFAYVKNLAKDGSFYWVFANITPDFNLKGDIRGFYSVRRKPTKKGLDAISGIYSKLLNAEKSAGVSESEKLLGEILKEAGGTYDEVIMSLQK